MRTLILDPDTMSPIAIGGKLMAALAFPAVHEQARMEAAASAWASGHCLCPPIFNPPSRVGSPNPFARFGKTEPQGALRSTVGRLRQRMIAARMARGFIREAIARRPARLPPPMKRHSLNELTKLVQSEARQSDPENIEKRVWRTSRRCQTNGAPASGG